MTRSVMSSSAMSPPVAPTSIVVGVDYDETCRAATHHALALGCLFNVRVHLLHASESPYAGHGVSSQTPHAEATDHNLIHAIQHEEAESMQAFVTSLALRDPIAWSVESGDPKRVVLDFVHKEPGCWLVLGARKHSAVSEWFLGSTAGYVVRHCQVPVLVVPPRSTWP